MTLSCIRVAIVWEFESYPVSVWKQVQLEFYSLINNHCAYYISCWWSGFNVFGIGVHLNHLNERSKIEFFPNEASGIYLEHRAFLLNIWNICVRNDDPRTWGGKKSSPLERNFCYPATSTLAFHRDERWEKVGRVTHFAYPFNSKQELVINVLNFSSRKKPFCRMVMMMYFWKEIFPYSCIGCNPIVAEEKTRLIPNVIRCS